MSGQVFGPRHHLDADGARLESRLQHPGRRHRGTECANRRLIEHVYEGRHAHAIFLGAHPHRQLVAEVAGGGLAHTGHAQVLAQGRGLFEVEVVERHDAVDGHAARQVAGAENQVVERPLLLVVVHEEDVVETLVRPVGVAQALGRDQVDARTLAFGLAQERLSLMEGRDTENGQRVSHERDPVQTCMLPSAACVSLMRPPRTPRTARRWSSAASWCFC